jgi:glyoxylase-like metal-dependent hydrolase (beta-lactamase superfamily II)
MSAPSVTRSQANEAVIHVFQAPVDKFFVNSFIVEGATGLVLIDTQFLVSSATELARRIQSIGKPLEAIVITHPHPDHFNGLPTILEAFGGVPVHATKPTIQGIAATQATKRAAWTPVYGSDYPPRDALPDHEIGPDATFALAGIVFRVIDLGPGESSDITVIHIPEADALVASDLVYSHCHPWLAEHRTQSWLAQLDRVAADFRHVGTVIPGHGPAGGTELLAAQRRYITDFVQLVRTRVADGALDPTAIAAIKAATTREREGWPLEMLIEMNASAIAEEITAGR